MVEWDSINSMVQMESATIFDISWFGLIVFDIRVATPGCLLESFAWKFFPSFYSVVEPVFLTELCFLYATKS